MNYVLDGNFKMVGLDTIKQLYLRRERWNRIEILSSCQWILKMLKHRCHERNGQRITSWSFRSNCDKLWVIN